MVIFIILLAATAAICLAIGHPRELMRKEDRFIVVWVFCVAAWQFIVIYLIGPLLWDTAEQAGQLSPGLQFLPALIVSAVAVMRGLGGERVEISLPAAVIGTTLVFAAVAVVLSGLQQAIHFAVAVVLFSGVLLKRGVTTVRTMSVAALVSLAAMAAATTVSVAINSDEVVADCRVDKCGFIPQALTSPFAGNGNVLGMVTALLVPFAVAALPLWRAVAALIGVGALQAMALSRTAIFAFMIVTIALVLIKFCTTNRWKLRIGVGALFVGFCASLVPLFLTYSGESYSYRGYVWDAGREAISQAPVFGHGPSYWHLLAQNALFDANYSPHNGWYDLLVAVGAWGVTLIVTGVAIQLFSTSSNALPYLLVYYAGILSINMLESVFVPYALGIMPIAALLPLMLYDPKPSGDPEMERHLVAFERSRAE